MRNEYKILVKSLNGKKQLGRSRYRWENNIKIKFKDRGCKDVDYIHLALDRVR
jgi:hypothetical protein